MQTPDSQSPVYLEGKSLCLRDWRLHDLEAFRRWSIGHYKWKDMNGPYYPSSTPEEIEQAVEVYVRNIEAGKWPRPRRMLVIAEKESDALLGTVSRYWQSEETNWLSIGLVIYDDANWGKGIGKEALSLWIGYLFDAMPELVRLDMRTWSGNVGMMKLAEKLGFKEEARFRMARIVKGEYFDGMGYGLLRKEWEATAHSFD